MVQYVRYASKECNQFCASRFDKKCAALYWFSSGFVRQAQNTVLQRFLPNVAQFGKTCHIFTGKVPQSLYCGALQDRDSVKVQCTQRDKDGAWYTTLISTTEARLLHSF